MNVNCPEPNHCVVRTRSALTREEVTLATVRMATSVTESPANVSIISIIALDRIIENLQWITLHFLNKRLIPKTTELNNGHLIILLLYKAV